MDVVSNEKPQNGALKKEKQGVFLAVFFLLFLNVCAVVCPLETLRVLVFERCFFLDYLIPGYMFFVFIACRMYTMWYIFVCVCQNINIIVLVRSGVK